MTGAPAPLDVVTLLRSAGLRPTRQRQALARLLFEDGDRHVTAEALYGEARAASVRVSLATIYNTLHQFTRAGLLSELVVDASRSYFDTNTRHHHHFFDEATGALTDIAGEAIAISALPAPPGEREITRVDVIVRVGGKPS